MRECRRAGSSPHEVEGDREITLSRDHLRPSAANFTRVCMTAFASRCVYYFMQLLLTRGWWAGRGREYRRKKARGSRGEAPAGWPGSFSEVINFFTNPVRHSRSTILNFTNLTSFLKSASSKTPLGGVSRSFVVVDDYFNNSNL